MTIQSTSAVEWRIRERRVRKAERLVGVLLASDCDAPTARALTPAERHIAEALARVPACSEDTWHLVFTMLGEAEARPLRAVTGTRA